MRLSHPAARLIGRPILLAPAGADALVASLRAELPRPGMFARLSEAFTRRLERSDPVARVPDALLGRTVEAKAGYLLVDGVAVIRIDGTLFDEGCTYETWSGDFTLLGYDDIRAAFRAADADPAVRGIWQRINSPGGHVLGMAETCDVIAGVSKPVTTFVAGDGCSAAYALAVSADRVVCAPASSVGSIGAVRIHQDSSKWDERMGFTITAIQFGAAKTDGYSFKPLSPEAVDHLQAQIDTIGERFVAHVARSRGLTPEAVRATEARVEMDEAALALDLVDAVQPEAEAFAAFAASLSANPAGAPATPPATKPASARAAANQEGPMGLKAQIEKALATRQGSARASAEDVLEEIRSILDGEDAEDEDETEAEAEADEDETEAAAEDDEAGDAEDEEEDDKPAATRASRAPKAGSAAYVLAITGLPEAKGREEQARQIAASGKFSVAEAKAFLAGLPKARGFAPQNPQVSADGGPTAKDPGARLFAAADRIAKQARRG